MGACASVAIGGGGDFIVDHPDGDKKDFHERFLEDEVLGEGEFGVVKRVRVLSGGASQQLPLACKTLRKGVVFKDNQLFAPLPPLLLRGEIEMLRALQFSTAFTSSKSDNKSHNYCLQLHSVYESSKEILVVTELCQGGEMLEYVAQQETDLRTEDISRIAYQLLSAVDHCAQHKIIHRDIKPQNVMFVDASPTSPLRLIDFGAGTLDTEFMASLKNATGETKSDVSQLGRHTTYAGTAFYNSPEMYQKRYTQKTDIFSVGVTLYVVTAGYPSDQLQKAFNVLQRSKNRDLRKQLPNIPQNMPDSFYDMLENLLCYQPKDRKTAQEMLIHPFVTFHQALLQTAVTGGDSTADTKPCAMLRRQSVTIQGSLDRHNKMLSYKSFERSLTTLLATVLSNADLVLLVNILKHSVEDSDGTHHDHFHDALEEQPVVHSKDLTGVTEMNESLNHSHKDDTSMIDDTTNKLEIIHLYKLLNIVEDDLCYHDVVDMIHDLPNAEDYTGFAYHTNLLMDIVNASKKLTMTPKQQRRLSHSEKKIRSSRNVMGGGSMRDYSSGSLGDSGRSFQSRRRQSSLPQRRESKTNSEKKEMQDGSSRSFRKRGRTKKPRAKSVLIRGL